MPPGSTTLAVVFLAVGCCAQSCVPDGEFDPSVDYFPTKLASDYSAGWEVTYHNSYKVIDVAGNHKIVAYQCGTPVPTVEGATMVVQIPFTTVTLMSTSYIPFFELIGYRQAIKGVNGIQSVSSPCLRDAIAAGNVSNIGTEDYNPSISDINTIGADAVFKGPWDNVDGINSPAIPVVETGEPTAIGGAEWLEYVALFLNAEGAAASHLASVGSRIASAEQVVSATIAAGAATRKRVLWVYEYWGTLYSGTCPNYYCEMIEKAGGEIIDLSGIGDPAAWGGITNFSAFYQAAATADVWLYPANNWDSTSMDADALAALPVVQNSMVYDITGNNRCSDGDCTTANDWFESRLAEPDVVLEDLINVITPEAHPTHDRVWFRNVMTESPGDDRTCSGPDDLYDLWSDSIRPALAAVPGSLQASITLNLDAADVGEPGTTERATFEAQFRADLAGAIPSVAIDQIIITGVTIGSVTVDFVIIPGADGQEIAADTVSNIVSEGSLTIAGATLVVPEGLEQTEAAPAPPKASFGSIEKAGIATFVVGIATTAIG